MSRLGCLIDRHYAMYRRHYLTALLIPAVLPWLLVGFMLLGSARVEPSWVMALLCCIFAFTAVIVRLTLRAYVMPGVTVAEMTLPVSGAERKLFAWGNSLFWTLIAAVIMWVEIQTRVIDRLGAGRAFGHALSVAIGAGGADGGIIGHSCDDFVLLCSFHEAPLYRHPADGVAGDAFRTRAVAGHYVVGDAAGGLRRADAGAVGRRALPGRQVPVPVVRRGCRQQRY